MNSTVDKENFAYWVTHPHDIDASSLDALSEAVHQYPYCPILYAMLAKVSSDTDSPQLPKYVPLAAAYSLNRSALRQLIENELAWPGSLLDRLSERPHRRVDTRDKATPYGQDKPISLVRFEGRFGPIPAFEGEPADEVPQTTPPVDDSVRTERVIEQELTHKKLKKVPVPPIELIPLPEPRVDERRKQQEIIEAFIKKDPRIGPIRLDADLPEEEPLDLTADANPESLGGLATESFARILAKQGKTEKAKAIYERLMLKNPEKSDYFAQKIAELGD